MRLAVKCALLAIPLEIALCGLWAYPVDNGFEPTDGLLDHATAYFWMVLHWPALLALRWLERRGAPAWDELLLFYMSGWLQLTVLLLLAALALRALLRRYRTAAQQPAQRPAH